MKCKCEKCGMEAKGLTCGKCDKAMVKGKVNKDGKEVSVAKCPSGCGAIKALACCGQDMTCSA